MGKGVTVLVFPALSGSVGFLVKDLMLLAAAVWSLGGALAVREHDEIKRIVEAFTLGLIVTNDQ